MDSVESGAGQIRRRYLAVDTSNVSDVLDELGLPDQALAASFAPYPANAGKLAGWAFPIRGEMTPYPLTDGDKAKMAACGALRPGDVSVWSGNGEGICFFGELIATGMQERGCAGAIVDGGVRDVTWIGRRGFPVYARYRTPVQSISRWRVVDSGAAPVPMPGATVTHVQVSLGDFVLADEDGVIVIPKSAAEKVLEKAEALGAREEQIRAEISAGLTLADALAKFGHV
jgi:4-hydroxy-4-methyl-2-oxoglutarate aldolase